MKPVSNNKLHETALKISIVESTKQLILYSAEDCGPVGLLAYDNSSNVRQGGYCYAWLIFSTLEARCKAVNAFNTGCYASINQKLELLAWKAWSNIIHLLPWAWSGAERGKVRKNCTRLVNTFDTFYEPINNRSQIQQSPPWWIYLSFYGNAQV